MVEEKTESALGWSRHVLDNPSPDVEAACRSLINRLEQSKLAAQTPLLSFNYFKLKKILLWAMVLVNHKPTLCIVRVEWSLL